MENDKTTEAKISLYLLSLKFNPKFKGFRYLRDAILLALKMRNAPFTLKKDIYPALLRKYNLKSVNMERNISNSIDNAFLNVDIADMEKIFGNTISPKTGKPGIKELIAAASVHIYLYETLEFP